MSARAQGALAADEILVRRLAVEDAPVVAELLGELGYPAEVAEVAARIDAWSADGARDGAFGAVIDGGLVGCAAVSLVPMFEYDGSRGRLVVLVVAARARGRGVGRALVRAASEFARAGGALELEVTSQTRREESHPFYRALGFEDMGERDRRYIAPL